MEHHFDIDHAENYGIEEAILINHFIFWLTKNRANNKTIKDIELEIDKKIQKVKRVFTYNSVSAMQEIFPYMNDKKIYRVIESLIEQKVIVRKYFNTNSYNRTSWYCFYDESHFLKIGNGKDKKEKSISQKQEMDLLETGNHYKDNNKDNNKDEEKKDSLSYLNLKSKFAEKLKSKNIQYFESRKEYGSISLMQELKIEPQEILDMVDILETVKKNNPNDKFLQGICFTMSHLVSYRANIYNAHNATKSNVVTFPVYDKEQLKKEGWVV